MRTLFDRDPFSCEFASTILDGKHVLCTMNGKVWTNCQEWVCGEEPMCCYEPPDNSEEAVKRRKAWIEAHNE